MHIAFADESYSKNFYFMGGVIVTTTQLKSIEVGINRLITIIWAERSKETLFDIEIHGSEGNFPRKINHLVDTLYFVDSKHSRGIKLPI